MLHKQFKAYHLAKEICETLFHAGYTAYFAGGWVRDYLLGQESDEIDIATSAPPYVIQQMFSKTIPVGIAFGVVMVVIEGMNFEVTTFRKDHPYLDGRHPEGVDFSTPEKDAQRRDFTINGMFYDPLNGEIYDYVGGQNDLKKKTVKAIGNPYDRLSEDKLRMMRAIRFSAHLGFQLDAQTALAIQTCAHLLFPAVSMERVWQELCKMASSPSVAHAFFQMHELGLLKVILPQIELASEKEIAQRISNFKNFPSNVPPILYIMELIAHIQLAEKIEICIRLKTPAQDRKVVTFFDTSRHLFLKQVIEPYEWAHFYAHPLSFLFIEIEAVKREFSEERYDLRKHAEQRITLEKHIARIIDKTPLVKAHDLEKRGICSGKKMGDLLKQAERVAINDNLNTSEEVLLKLFGKG